MDQSDPQKASARAERTSVKKYLLSFAALLPIADLFFWAAMVVVPGLLFFFRLKHAAHGMANASLTSRDFQIVVSSQHLLPFAFDHAGWTAEKWITVLDAPAKYVEVVVSLIVSRTGNWWPASLLPSTWRSLMYPIYALPAWFFVGRGFDALLRRTRVTVRDVIASIVLALVSAVVCCGLRFGLSAAERQGQDLVKWFIEGLALWAVLFAVPFAAWVRQKKVSL